MISRNDLLEYAGADGKTIRVLWIDTAQASAYVYDVQAHSAEAELARVAMLQDDLVTGRARLLQDDPYMVVVNQDLLPAKHLALRARAWEIVRELTAMEPAIYEPRRRGQLVAEYTQRHGVSHPTIYRYLRRYWQRGQTPNALLPDYANSGGRGKTRAASEGVKRGRPRKAGAAPGVNVDEPMRAVFRVAVARHAAAHPPLSRRAIFDQMLRDFFCRRRIDAATLRVQRHDTVEAQPTFGQFSYWLEQDQLLEAQRIAPPLAPESAVTRPGRPGAAFRVDVVQADVQLVSRADRGQVTGKPYLYVVTDIFSGVVAGTYVGMEQPGWAQALMALANSAADKRRYCLRHGLDIVSGAWPARHLPELLFADAALLGNADDCADSTLRNNFNVRCLVAHEDAPAAWRVELGKRFKLLPRIAAAAASAGAAADDSGGLPCGAVDAVLDLEQFTRIAIGSVMAYNHKPGHDGRTPQQLWDWGVAMRGAALRQYSEELVHCSLLPVSDALVTADGILLHGTYYSCARAVEGRWFERAAQRGHWQVKVACDASSLDTVYLLDPQAPMHFHACHIAERSKAHRRLSSAEVARLRAGDPLARPHVQHVQQPGQYASFERIVAALAG
ncbi:hypothetical protein LJR289_005521 [Pseudoduganella sp. LjRoot289]|uniref:Mu transposase C-terminal domain-containing protein n=1 Tax=Pseudoduganella sp. LjRoot289 TaxID=3342314 RepID=UPI003ECCD0ED